MFIIPSEKIRKYVAYSTEEGTWIHDPLMPASLEDEFQKFKKLAEENSTTPINIDCMK